MRKATEGEKVEAKEKSPLLIAFRSRNVSLSYCPVWRREGSLEGRARVNESADGRWIAKTSLGNARCNRELRMRTFKAMKMQLSVG
jgi:hypothetical protein